MQGGKQEHVASVHANEVLVVEHLAYYANIVTEILCPHRKRHACPNGSHLESGRLRTSLELVCNVLIKLDTGLAAILTRYKQEVDCHANNQHVYRDLCDRIHQLLPSIAMREKVLPTTIAVMA